MSSQVYRKLAIYVLDGHGTFLMVEICSPASTLSIAVELATIRNLNSSKSYQLLL